jgi:hypothetical protein
MALGFLAGLATPADAASRKIKDLTAATSKNRGGTAKAPFGDMPKGPLQLVVSLAHQNVTLYSNGQRIAQAPVSTGTPSRPTPTGVFSIIEKDRWHHSNLYDNAPMFYMHRLTWSGVAMHEGVLPGVPASHGCIRLPREFAARLWAVSKLGVRVVVARNDVAPQDFDHPQLFARAQRPAESPAAAELPFDTLRPSLSELNISAAPPIRLVLATAVTTPGDGVRSAEQSSDATETAPVVTDPGLLKKAVEPPKRSGQVAVFVSRKEKKIFVRQGFVPLFDMPIEIANPDQPLGTHVFTALELKADGQMRWNAITMPSEGARAAATGTQKTGRKAERVAAQAEARPLVTAAQALERVQFPPEALERIRELLVPGSSLIISDYGLGTETGRSTEFIVVTR